MIFWYNCQIISNCYQQNTRFGLVGDSWTDFAFGTDLQRDFYDWLTGYHGYRITATPIAGQTISHELHTNKAYMRVIENAGPQINFMLLSLGGNDLLGNSAEYSSIGVQTVKNQRLAAFESNLRSLILQGNAYKINKYGGKPLKWIIHGYDYSNPELVAQCSYPGFSQAEKKVLLSAILDDFNVLLANLTTSIPDLYYIDLRGTLGGPPISNPSLKFDCIHPNDAGFQLLVERYVNTLQLITQER